MNVDKMLKKALGKPKTFGGRRDLDGDGVPNRRDCQPRNTMRQDNTSIKKTIMKKIIQFQNKYDDLIDTGKIKVKQKYWNIVMDIGRPGFTSQPIDYIEEFRYIANEGTEFPQQARSEAKIIFQEIKRYG